jgi:hypothetical protein
MIRTVEQQFGYFKRDVLLSLGELSKYRYANTPEQIAFTVLAGARFEEPLEEYRVP